MMPGTTLTVPELADELNRSVAWIYEHWQAEAKAGRLPKPLNGGKPPLTWDRAQVYACRDRELSPPQRIAAMAYRAAAAAAADAPHVGRSAIEDAEWREKLNQRFGAGP
jgi:predicted DNA-binding transcriptional regulator AlpA